MTDLGFWAPVGMQSHFFKCSGLGCSSHHPTLLLKSVTGLVQGVGGSLTALSPAVCKPLLYYVVFIEGESVVLAIWELTS